MAEVNLDFLGAKPEIAGYWNNRVVAFKGQRQILDHLPCSDEIVRQLSEKIENGVWEAPIEIPVNVSKLESDGSHIQEVGVSFDRAKSRYGGGFSICFGDLSESFAQLKRLKEAAGHIFGEPSLISITGYLSPQGSTGVLHFDRQHNFFLQKEGRKRWLVGSTAAIKNPVENFVYNNVPLDLFERYESMGYKIKLPKDCGREEFVLAPGDALYVPPGFFHSPQTLDTHSFHYTLTLEPNCFWNSVLSKSQRLVMRNHENFYADWRFLQEAEKDDLLIKCRETFPAVTSR